MLKSIGLKRIVSFVLMIALLSTLFIPLQVSAATSVTVSSTVTGKTMEYLSGNDVIVDSDRVSNPGELKNAGANMVRIWDLCMDRIEERHDDDNNYGSPSISAIKADSANGFSNTVPWSYWDGVTKNNIDFDNGHEGNKQNLQPLYSRLLAFKNAGIRMQVCLRPYEAAGPGFWSYWLPRPNQDGGLTTEWLNEWWEYCFAVAYWCNTRNNLGITDWQILNEPDINGGGWDAACGGSKENYITILDVAKDALDYAASFSGQPAKIYSSVSWDAVTDFTKYAFEQRDNKIDVYDWHYYEWAGKSIQNSIDSAQSMLSAHNPDGAIEPMFISEYGTYMNNPYSGSYNQYSTAKLMGDNLMTMAKEGVYGASLFCFWDWGGGTGVVDATSELLPENRMSETLYAHALCARALNGKKDMLSNSYTGSGKIITTKDANNLYILMKDLGQTVNLNIGGAGVTVGTATVYEYSQMNKDKIVSYNTVSSGNLTVNAITDGFTLAVVSLSNKLQPPDGVRTDWQGDGSVRLSWNMVDGATSYRIKYSTISGSYTNEISGITANSKLIQGLTNGTEYFFTIIAENAGGQSATTSKEVRATPNILYQQAFTGSDNTLPANWTNQSSTGCSAAIGSNQLKLVINQTTAWSNKAQAQYTGGSYGFGNMPVIYKALYNTNSAVQPYIELRDAGGNKITTYTNTAGDVFLSVVDGSYSSGAVRVAQGQGTSATLSTVIKNDAVEVYNGINLLGSLSHTFTNTTDYSPYVYGYSGTAGTTYGFIDNFVISGYQVPSVPNTLTVNETKEQYVKLSWLPVRRATAYRLWWGTASGSYSNSAVINNAISYELTGLTNDTTYYIRLEAMNDNGVSARSQEISAVPSSTYYTTGFTGTNGSYADRSFWTYGDGDNDHMGASRCTIENNMLKLQTVQTNAWSKPAGVMLMQKFDLASTPLKMEAQLDTNGINSNVYMRLKSESSGGPCKIDVYLNNYGSVYYRIQEKKYGQTGYYDSGDVLLGSVGSGTATIRVEVTNNSLKVFKGSTQIGSTINRNWCVTTGFKPHVYTWTGVAGTAATYVDNFKIGR